MIVANVRQWVPTFDDVDDVLSAHVAVAEPPSVAHATAEAGARRDVELAAMDRAAVIDWAVMCADLSQRDQAELRRSIAREAGR